MAALSLPSAIVCVGPPFEASGLRSIAVAVVCVAAPQLLSSETLCASAVRVPLLEQAPTGLLTSSVFRNVAVPPFHTAPPTAGGVPPELLEKVLLVTFSVPELFKIAPAATAAEFPEKVLFEIVALVVNAPSAMAPPRLDAVLVLNVLFATLSVPSLY